MFTSFKTPSTDLHQQTVAKLLIPQFVDKIIRFILSMNYESMEIIQQVESFSPLYISNA